AAAAIDYPLGHSYRPRSGGRRLMKRMYVLGAIVVAGMVAAAASGLDAQQPAGQGQGRGGGGGGQAGVSAISKVAENLYQVPGAGGTTAVFVTANGVVLV